MLSDIEYKVLKALEDGLPLTPDPYGALAQSADLEREVFCAAVAGLKSRGVIRRVGVVLRHHNAGVRGNIMAALNVPAAKLANTGERLAQSPAVSHCYARQSDADWPYNLYAMVHAARPNQARQIAENLCAELGISDFTLLATLKELKKTSFACFFGF